MAKVQIKNLTKVLKILEQKVNQVTKADPIKKTMGEYVIDRILGFARSGFSLIDNKKPLPKLSSSYVEFRKGLAYYYQRDGDLLRVPERSNKLNLVDKEFFKPNSKKSNLTFTGDLLRALSFMFTDNGVKLFFKNKRRIDSKEKNSNIFQYLVDKNPDYNILTLDQKGRDQLRQIIKREIRRQLRSGR
jgi:hypothetical protein